MTVGVPPRLTLFSRTYCHLCEDMRAGLEALRADYTFELEVLDVDADPALEARYDELVPVLTADDEELCHYFLDVPKVREYLARFR